MRYKSRGYSQCCTHWHRPWDIKNCTNTYTVLCCGLEVLDKCTSKLESRVIMNAFTIMHPVPLCTLRGQFQCIRDHLWSPKMNKGVIVKIWMSWSPFSESVALGFPWRTAGFSGCFVNFFQWREVDQLKCHSVGTKFNLTKDSTFLSLVVCLDHTTSMYLKGRDLENTLGGKFIQRNSKIQKARVETPAPFGEVQVIALQF